MNYPANLCDLSDEEQHAIEVDKQRWYLAYKIYHSHTHDEVQAWLNNKTDDIETRQDMLRRFNVLDNKHHQQVKQATERMQQGIRCTKRKNWGKSEEERIHSNG